MTDTNEAWEEEQMSNLGCESVSDLIAEVKRLQRKSEIVREIIDCLCTEEMDWQAIAEHFELCHSCGGIPTGSYVSNTPFIECESHNCDVAFELMCDDFIDETGNGNTFRCLVGMLYDEIVKHGDTEAYLAAEIDESILNSENPLISYLNTWGRESLNSAIVGYWEQDREMIE
jgi:hypothetical protein